MMARFFCLVLTIASLSVLGVWPQSTPSPPPCVLACLDSSAQSASCSSTDVQCICNSDVFANDVASCVVSNCSTTDAAAAVGFFNALCSGDISSSVSLSLSGTPSTGSFSTGSGSVTSTASSGSTSGSSPSSSPPSSESRSGLSRSTEQSSVFSTTSGASRSSTNSITDSSTSASSATPFTTPPVNHAVRGHTSMSFAGAGFALALAVALVAW
ncbi:hypothetical protein BGY98DRAFT_729290 [Russula aff. rugulosa BPL654]|nr:hypothetical protein BGY98DRAFT_729290 [Russula aff. rugulosa BPL654]